MSCNAYNENNSPYLEISGVLPDDYCFTTAQQFATDLVAAIQARMSGKFSTFIISDSEPASSDRDKLWVHVDSATCQPVGIKLYYNGVWTTIGVDKFWGTDTSITANVITVTSTFPQVSFQKAGQTFFIKANGAPTGPTTITIKDGSGNNIYNTTIKKYGSQDLQGLEYLSGSVLILHWDGTNLQLVNPRPNSSANTTGGANLSFESDLNSDGIPDDWSVYTAGAVYPGNGGSGGDNATAPTGGSSTLDSSQSVHGGKSIKFHAVNGGVTAGGGFIQNAGYLECDAGKPVEFSFFVRASAADLKNKAQIIWYSSNDNSPGDYISTTTVWTNATNNAVGQWYKYGAVGIAPSNAKFYRIRLWGGEANNPTIGDVWFDDVRIGPVEFPYSYQLTNTGSGSITTPSSVKQIKVKCVGGGGGGGGGNGITAASGGGGAGGTAISYLTPPLTTQNVYPYSVGAGGAGGLSNTTGSAGSNTTFNTTDVIGNGGGGGVPGGAGGAGGAGGTGTGTLVYAGEDGWSNGGNATADVSNGGSSTLGGGGGSKLNAAGGNASNYGGGGGGTRSSTPSTYLGGAGSQGVIIIYYWA